MLVSKIKSPNGIFIVDFFQFVTIKEYGVPWILES
jgi:hypothetical protein